MYKTNDKGEVVDFGGWESEKEKLRHNLTLTPEQILNWLEEVNKFNREIKEETNVLRGDSKKV